MKLDLSDAVAAAPMLLGWQLVHNSPVGRTSGYIVETEAYTATDAASHSFRGKSARNSVMFGPSGNTYVYFTYGKHYCVNIVTGSEGEGQAVLIRALQPVDGLELMTKRRHKPEGLDLTNGPAKLAQAMDIDKQHNGQNLFNSGPLTLLPGIKPDSIVQTTRIGITQAKDLPWRFYIKDNPYVSKN